MSVVRTFNYLKRKRKTVKTLSYYKRTCEDSNDKLQMHSKLNNLHKNITLSSITKIKAPPKSNKQKLSSKSTPKEFTCTIELSFTFPKKASQKTLFFLILSHLNHKHFFHKNFYFNFFPYIKKNKYSIVS